MGRWMTILLALILASPALGDILSYCAKQDESYQWEKGEERELSQGGKVVDLKMTSQTWMDIPWKHTIRLLVPPDLNASPYCGLYITGGNPKEEELGYLMMVAKMTGWPMAILYNIPNQPLYDGLREDALISFTFMKVMETQDLDWPLLFPMTKSVVKAMDAIQEYASQNGKRVDGFMTFGASKRGWTTWFTGVVDPRVKGMCPTVYDNLNLDAQMPHQVVAFGGYSQEIDDYSEKGLPEMLGSDQGKLLASMVDPYTYRHRVVMPKLIIIGSNDPYWPLDALNLYYSDLYGDRNYILYVPNKGHGVDDMARVLGGLGCMAKMLDGSLPYPELAWQCQEEGDRIKLTARSSPPAQSMKAWCVVSPDRDFRDNEFVASDMVGEDGTFTFSMPKPDGGYQALFGEYVFPVGTQRAYLSTNVYVIGPDPETKEMKILSRP